MENYPIDLTRQPEEVVLTYRQSAQPVVLRYERALPERMRQEQDAAFAGDLALCAAAGKKRRRRRRIALAALILLLAAGLVGAGLWYMGRPTPGDGGGARPGQGDEYDDEPYYWNLEEEPAAETTIDTYRPYGGSAARLELTGADDRETLTPDQIYEKVWPSTVTVLGEDGSGYSVGTGIIFSRDGYILTNYHVIAGCSACYVWVDNEYGMDQEYEARLVGGDDDQDLAVLKIEAQDLTAAEFGISDDLSVGDSVYAIGNPLGLELRGTFTDGIVSAVNRDVDVDGITMTLIQTNTALNSGNSGGPLINQYGQVVGINTIKMMSGYDTIEGLGFAIPTSICVRWVNEMIETGGIQPQPVLGLSIERTPVALPDGTTGLKIVSITEGSGADLAGLQLGDCVVSFNGQSVSRTEDVLAIRRELHVGDRVPICIWRDGEYLELTIEMMAQ